MTLLTGIWEPVPQYADTLIEGSRKLLPELPWLVHLKTKLGRLTLSLDSAPMSPFSTFQTSSGYMVFVLGDIPTSTRANTAAWLCEQCIEHGPLILARQNGYYLAGIVDEYNTVYLACDQLGLMPLYYWAKKNTFVFSTIPNAFLSHPDFRTKPDLMGIAATLLTMHCTGNRTIWQNVSRLPSGHLLKWQENIGIQLTNVNSLKAHDQYFGWPLGRCQRLLEDSFFDSVHQLSDAGETAILLSGGLDSRIVAGTLSKKTSCKVPVVTIGNPIDYEMLCAKRVARSLGWEMHPVRTKLEDYPIWAQVQAQLEGMQTSFVEFIWWQSLETLYKLKPRIMTGLLGDAVMGALQTAFGFDDFTGKYSFDTQFDRINRYGFRASDVSTLLREPGIGEAVVEELYRTWSDYEGLPFQKCWLFDLHHRQRMHVGPIAWRLSFASWPTLPYADMTLMHAMAGMAMPAISDRRVQIAMLRRKFPKLATIPLDYVDHMCPIQPGVRWAIERRLNSLLDALNPNHVERKQFVRHFAVSGPGWQTIRQKVETYRSLMEDLFDPKALEAMLPHPSQPLTTPDPIIDGAKYKTLLGLMMHFGLLHSRYSLR